MRQAAAAGYQQDIGNTICSAYPQSCWRCFFNASFSSSGASIEQYAHARFLLSINRSPFLSGIRLPEGP